MTGAGEEAVPAKPPARSRSRDPRIWLGVGVTGFCVWLALRDAPFAEVGRVISEANWWILIGMSAPGYLLAVYLRGLRWRHLVDPIEHLPAAPLIRGVTVGFTANNLLPLRVGEVIRTWYVARETGISAASVLMTVVIERVLDTVMVILLVLGGAAIWGSGSDSPLAKGALLLLPVGVTPLVALVALRRWPDAMVGLARFVLRPFPERWGEAVEGLMRRSVDGLGALSGGRHLLWLIVHSLGIWLVASTMPILAGLLALGIDLGSPLETLGAAWVTLGAVGVAVALPSAPGFFGPYHVACKLALVQFGVPAETAVALGTLTHAIFWVMLTLPGLLVLRSRHTSLFELGRATELPDPTPR